MARLDRSPTRPAPLARAALPVAVLLVRVLLVAVLLGARPESRLGADPPGRRGERVLAGLASGEAPRRRSALAELVAAARADGALAARALPTLKEILRQRGPEERALVARALGALPGPQVLETWERTLLAPDEDDRVLAAAMDGLAERGPDPPLATRLVELSGDLKAPSTTRALALEALGALGGLAADMRLTLARPAADWVEESGRALGLARLAGPAALESLVALLGNHDVAPRVHAWEGLVRLTGKQLPPERAPWEAWLLARGAADAPPAPGAPANPDERYAPPAPAHVPRYYGVPVPKRAAVARVVFCCDVSQSMYGPPLDRSRRELAKTLKELTTAHRFDVIAFNENALPWAGRLVRAHPVQKVRALDWYLNLEPTSYTNIYDAVEIALGYAGRGRKALPDPEPLDAVFLLSDGEPNRGRYREPAQLVRELAELAQPGIPIHTIGAGEAAFALLRDIAARTGGTFTDAFE